MPAVVSTQFVPVVDAPTSSTFKSVDPQAVASSSAQVPTPVSFPAPEPIAHPAVLVPASLYVGDLGDYVTESHLFELFNLVGPVASIRVCRDSVTRRSLGYAYVNYHSASDAERAIETLNHTPIQGKACRVMWSQRDPSFRKVGSGNVFIKNLDPSIDNKALHDTFNAFGKILSCKVVYENGVSKGYGFVHFERREDADTAINNVNGMLLNDFIVYVGHHESAKDRMSKVSQAHATFTNVYVKGIHPSVTSEVLEELFAKHGKITSCLVKTDEEGKSKEFGFVNFENHEEAVSAIQALNDLDFNGSKLSVCRAQKKSERESELRKQFQAIKEEKIMKSQGVNLYVKNLEDDVDEEKLRGIFAPYGTITSCKIMTDEKSKSRGFGFVCFSTPAESTKAMVELNNRMIGSKPLYVNYAQRKDDRRSQLEAQRSAHMPMGMPAPMYPNTAIFYPPNPNYPPPAQRNMMYGQPGMMPPRPRWNNAQQLLPGQYSPNMNGAQPFPQQQQQTRGHRQPRQNNRNNSTRPSNSPRSSAAPVPIPTPVPVSESAAPVSPGLTAASLAAASPSEQKQMLGEALFPLIQERTEEHAGKITGMLLEMDNDELLHLIESPEALEQKVTEAIIVLEQHTPTQ